MPDRETIGDAGPLPSRDSGERVVSDRQAIAPRVQGALQSVQEYFVAPSRETNARVVSDRQAITSRSTGILESIGTALVPSTGGSGVGISNLPSPITSGDKVFDSLIDLFGKAFGYDQPQQTQAPGIVSVPTGSSGGSNGLLIVFGIGLIAFVVWYFYLRKKQNV